MNINLYASHIEKKHISDTTELNVLYTKELFSTTDRAANRYICVYQ